MNPTSVKPTKTHFFTHEVIVLTGFSKYMLDYLVREEIFVPSLGSQRIKGLKRRYTYQDVVLLRTLHEICVRKGKISHLRDALNRFRREFGSLLPGQRVDQK